MSAPVIKAPCRVPECSRALYAKGMCSVHYDRVRRTGTTDDPKLKVRKTGPCSVSGCETPLLAKGLCRMHWERQHRTGTTDDPKPRTGPLNPMWVGDEVSYGGMHCRLEKLPRPGFCTACGTSEGRFEWALNQGVPKGRLLKSPEGYAYSTRTEDYSNLCKLCHNRQDLRRHTCRNGHDMTNPDNVYVNPTHGRYLCRTCLNTVRRAKYAARKNGGTS